MTDNIFVKLLGYTLVILGILLLIESEIQANLDMLLGIVAIIGGFELRLRGGR